MSESLACLLLLFNRIQFRFEGFELSKTTLFSLMLEQLQFPALTLDLNLNPSRCFRRQHPEIKITSKIKKNGGIGVARPDRDFNRFY